MRGADTVGMAFGAMRTHKLRTALTTLGVVIGIGSVVAMVTLGSSFEVALLQQLGADELVGMTAEAVPSSTLQGPQGQNQPRAEVRAFTARDVAALRGLQGVTAVAPIARVPVDSASAGGLPVLLQGMVATTADHPDIVGDIAQGQAFRSGSLEAVVGHNVTTFDGRHFAPGDGMDLRLADGRALTVRVVGVLAHKEQLLSQLANFQVYVPLEPFYTHAERSPATGQQLPAYPTVYVRADTDDNVPAVKERALAYLRSADSDASKLLPHGYEVRVTTNQENASALAAAIGQFTLFIGGVAVISLVVGAIGIANIMLVAVTERTREIGVLKALGARNRDVRRLFLAESFLIGLAGGVVGLLLGAALGYVLTKLVFASSTRPVPVVWPVEWFGIAIVTGMAVGVMAGYLPARRATKVDPIQALNYE